MPKKYQGLSNQQVGELLKTYGENILPQAQKITAVSLYFSQLKSPLIYILICASFITFYLKDYLNSIVILAAVIVNSVLGFVQEYKAKKSLEKLKTLLSDSSKVIRNGKTEKIQSKYLVPGDIVLLSSGDRIPADGEVLEDIKLLINEGLLTGESTPAGKKAGDKIFGGTTVIAGRGVVKIEKTGKFTEIGKIASELQKDHEEKTPLQKKLDNLANVLAIIVISLSLIVFLIGILTKEDPYTIFTTSLAIAVSAIPEGLAVSLTAILAVGMQRILKRKAIVRKLISAETLGSVTLIATDKTGTLTEGQMRITKTHLINESQAIKTAVFANNTETPIEIALWDWVRGFDIDPDLLQETSKRDEEIPFSPETKFMAVRVGEEIFIKGAPEIVFSMCDLSPSQKEEIQKILDSYSKEGFHTIALAHKNLGDLSNVGNLESELKNLTFLGLLGAEDPVRPSVIEAIQNCRKAGLKVVVVTGDYQKTAAFVLQKIGLPITNPETEVIDGRELEEISPEELTKRIEKIKLFARVSPHQKLKIVRALQDLGEIVAVTGDGVNDALALKEADIGIVVNSASDVAKDTADIILLDSNFSTIIAAIEEGRGIFDNIRRVTLYLISDVFSEITIILTGLILSLPLPLTAAQILWINIIGDGLPNLALTIEPKSRNLLNRPPKDPNEPLLNAQMKSLILIISVVSGLFAVAIFVYYLKTTGDLALARTMAFTLHAVDSLIYVFAARALTKPIYKVNPLKNPTLILAVAVGFLLQIIVVYTPTFNSLFKTTPISLTGWLQIISLSALVIIAIEATKKIFSPPHLPDHHVDNHY